MVDFLDTKNVTQYTESLISFQVGNYLDDMGVQRGASAQSGIGRPTLNLYPIGVLSGDSPWAPTLRFTCKRKLGDPILFSLWRKTIPPYPASTSRVGMVVDQVADHRLALSPDGSKTILYIRGQPWWYWYASSFPIPPAPSYTYDPNNPPTNWDPLGGYAGLLTGAWGLGFNLIDGEAAFLIYAHELWMPTGAYFTWIEIWMGGNGTPPALTRPAYTLAFQLIINPRPQTDESL